MAGADDPVRDRESDTGRAGWFDSSPVNRWHRTAEEI